MSIPDHEIECGPWPDYYGEASMGLEEDVEMLKAELQMLKEAHQRLTIERNELRQTVYDQKLILESIRATTDFAAGAQIQ